MALNWSMDRGAAAAATAGEAAGETAGEAAGLTAGEGAASAEGEDATAGEAATAGDAAGLGAAVGATVGGVAGAVVGAAVGVGGACEQPASPATQPTNARNAQRLSAPAKMLRPFYSPKYGSYRALPAARHWLAVRAAVRCGSGVQRQIQISSGVHLLSRK